MFSTTLNISIAGLISFIKHYLDPCLAANVFTQYKNDIVPGVNNFDEMITALRKDFDCLGESGLKFSAHNIEFVTTKIEYLGNTFTPYGISPGSVQIKTIYGTN